MCISAPELSTERASPERSNCPAAKALAERFSTYPGQAHLWAKMTLCGLELSEDPQSFDSIDFQVGSLTELNGHRPLKEIKFATTYAIENDAAQPHFVYALEPGLNHYCKRSSKAQIRLPDCSSIRIHTSIWKPANRITAFTLDA